MDAPHAAPPAVTLEVLVLINQPAPICSRYAERLAAAFPQLAFGAGVESAEVLITQGSMMSDELLRRAGRLQWIHAITSGTDGIDNLPSLPREVLLTSTRGIHGTAVSEAALAGMLALSRNLHVMLRNQQDGLWARPGITLLEGKTVGIFGVGVIGSALAAKCKALGMKVVGVDPLLPNVAAADRMLGWDDGLCALGEFDYVVLLVPSSARTRRIVGAAFLARMKATSFLVSLGRGEVLDEDALAEALRAGRIAGAALDVFAREPLPPEHPFWSMPNVIVTPHCGGIFDDYADRALPIIEENMRRFLAGERERLINLVRH